MVKIRDLNEILKDQSNAVRKYGNIRSQILMPVWCGLADKMCLLSEHAQKENIAGPWTEEPGTGSHVQRWFGWTLRFTALGKYYQKKVVSQRAEK
jgi:hypothetical protein